MQKLKSLLALSCLCTAVLGCNSTSNQKTFNFAPYNNYGQQQTASSSNNVCHRPSDSSDITVTTRNLKLTKNQNKGCFGSDNKFCDIRIYQIMVESFRHSSNGAIGYATSWGPSNHNGNIRGIIDSLNYIKSTGVNAIWLTPVFKTTRLEDQDYIYDRLDGTGYFTSDYFEVDPKFGNKKELKELIDKAHSLGLYVFFDGVLGHSKVNVNPISPKGNKLKIQRRCRDWDGRIDKMSLVNGTCFDNEASMPFLKEFVSYWIEEFKIDGWRFDQAYQLSPEQWKEIRLTIEAASANKKSSYLFKGKKVQPLGFNVAEYWSDNPAMIDRNGFKGNGVTSVMNFPLRDELVSVLATRDEPKKPRCAQEASNLDAVNKKSQDYSGSGIAVSFLGNHDLPRFGDLLQRTGNTSKSGKDQEMFNAHKEALSFIAAQTGPMIIYYGEETADELAGFDNKVDSGCSDKMVCEDHVSRTTGHVDNLTKDEKELKDYVSQILNLRDKHLSLSHGNRVHIYSDATVYMDLKTYKNDKVIYALNNSSDSRNVAIKADALAQLGLQNCTLSNALTKESVSFDKIVLPAVSGTFLNVECK